MDEFENTQTNIVNEPAVENKPVTVKVPTATNTAQAKNPEVPAPKGVSKSVLIFAGIVVLLLVGILLFSQLGKKADDETIIDEVEVTTDTVLSDPSEILVDTKSYIQYNQAEFQSASNKKRILFFAASWCPTCTKLDIDIQNNIALLGSDTIIFKVDYDSATELKSQYSVTNQHTLISVNSSGAELKRVLGSPTLSDALVNL
jgi:thioredoxin 1